MRTVASFSVVLVMVTVLLASGGVESMMPVECNLEMPECEMVSNEFSSCFDFLNGHTEGVDGNCCNLLDKLNMAVMYGQAAGPNICCCIQSVVSNEVFDTESINDRTPKLPSMCGSQLPISEAIMNCNFPAGTPHGS